MSLIKSVELMCSLSRVVSAACTDAQRSERTEMSNNGGVPRTVVPRLERRQRPSHHKHGDESSKSRAKTGP